VPRKRNAFGPAASEARVNRSRSVARAGKRIRRVYVLGGLGLAAALWVIDFSLQIGSLNAFVPPSASYVLSTPDFPKTWAEWNESELRAAVLAESGDSTRDFFVELRKQTGIRWTPTRFRLWFGRTLVVTGEGERWAAMVRPGLLYRVIARIPFLNRTLSGNEGGDKKVFFSAYRDGIYVFANDASWLHACLSASAQTVQVVPRGLYFNTRGRDAWSCHLPSFSSGFFNVTYRNRDIGPAAPRLITEDDPLKSASVIRGHDWSAWMQRFREWRPESNLMNEWTAVLREMDSALPEGWADEPAPFVLVLRDIEVNGTRPLPSIAVVLTEGDGMASHEIPPDAHAYAWGDADGWMRFLDSDRLAVGYAESAGLRYYVSSEPLMREIAHREFRVVETEIPTVSVEADAGTLLYYVRQMLLRAAENELLPHRSLEDVEEDFRLPFELAAQLERLNVSARHDGEVWTARVMWWQRTP
jgi:hypothetical protein